MRISSVFLLASLVVSGFAQVTVDNVLADINTIASLTSTLNNAIKSFPNTGGTLLQALPIHTSAMVLRDAIDKATTDAKALPAPVSAADGQSLLTTIKTLTPIIIDTLDNIVAKKPTVNALPLSIPAIVSIVPISVPALVEQDLVKVNASAIALEDALLEAAPADLVPTGFDLKSQVDTAFARAIATYT